MPQIPNTQTLGRLAAITGGKLVGGEASTTIHDALPIGEATANCVTMIDDPTRLSRLDGCAAAAIVTTKHMDLPAIAQIIVDDCHAAFMVIVKCFRDGVEDAGKGTDLPSWGIDPSAKIADSAFVHPGAVVGPNVTIGSGTHVMPGVVLMQGVSIGDDCVIHAGVTLYERTEIADRVVIHSRSVLGAHGFGYRQYEGRHVPTAQLGWVKVESDVEIGACVTIDRGTYGATLIGEGTKIDNQVQIAHNCRIGKHNLLCSQVGIAGSCTTGDYVVMAGQVGVKDHINVGDHAIIAAQSGVMDDCKSKQVYLGSPATVQRDQMQIFAIQRKLPEMRRELKSLRNAIDEVIAQSDAATQSIKISPQSSPKRAA